MRSPQCVRALVLVASAVLAGPALGADDARGWLERMGQALETLNYEGTLIQLQGTDVAVMRIVHRVENGVQTERITALDDVGREIIRQEQEVIFILPDEQAVMVGARGEKAVGMSPLRQQLGGVRFDDLYYKLTAASAGKLLGRTTHLVTIQPADTYRFGYRVWLDQATGMPLKVQIADSDGEVVEQLRFSDISLPERIPASALQSSAKLDSYTWQRPPAASGSGPSPAEKQGNWRAVALPPGFSLRAVRSEQAEEDTDALEQLVYSDGVASVSVFVESGVAAAERGEGPSRMGAANAYTTDLGVYMITAVGEVPLSTVKAIARAIRPTGPTGPTGP